jgi:hypothetical protein
MSNRRGAPSDEASAVERREWYDSVQKQVFFQESSDDDSEDGTLYKADAKDIIERARTAKSGVLTADGRKTGEVGRPETSSLSQNKDAVEDVPFVSFAANLAKESEERAVKLAADLESSETVLSTSKAIKEYDRDVLDRCLLRLNSPPETRYVATIGLYKRPLTNAFRAILLCTMGFNDNGLMLQNYAGYLEEFGIEMLSMAFPGKTAHATLSATHSSQAPLPSLI